MKNLVWSVFLYMEIGGWRTKKFLSDVCV